MARVEEWFRGFQLRLLDVLDRADWAPADSEFWLAFRSSLVRGGVTEAEAAEALYLLAESPPRWPSELIPAFRAQVETVRALNAAVARSGGEIPADRAAAEAAAAGCDDCGGTTGLTYRFRSDPADPRGPYVVLYCLCQLGRWLKADHARGDESARQVGRRLPDLADYPALYGPEHRQPPGTDPAALDRWPGWAAAVRGIAATTAPPAPPRPRPGSPPTPPPPPPPRPRRQFEFTPAEREAIKAAPDVALAEDGKSLYVIPPWRPTDVPAY